MNPPADFRERLEKALCDAFDVSGLRRFCDYPFTVDTAEINWNESFLNVVGRLIELAMQHGRLPELVWKARLARPRRPDLAALWKEVRTDLPPQAADTLVEQEFGERGESSGGSDGSSRLLWLF